MHHGRHMADPWSHNSNTCQFPMSAQCTHVQSYIYISLTHMLLVANCANTKGCKKAKEMSETFACGYSSESSHQELSNKYQYDRVQMFFKILYILDLWTKVALALEGLINGSPPYMYS